MAGVRVEISFDESQFKKTDKQIHQALSKGISKLALFGQGRAMQYVPVKTGHLRRSIHYIQKGPYQAGYSTAVKYAAIQEFGNLKDIEIRPKRKKALTIPTPDGIILRKKATIKKGRIKGKHYMKKSIEDVKRNAKEILLGVLR